MNKRGRIFKWRPVRRGFLMRAVASGWEWWTDPRRGGTQLRSPRGTMYEFTSNPVCSLRRHFDGGLEL